MLADKYLEPHKSGRPHLDRWRAFLHGLHKQVGTIYPDHDQDRDSSREFLIIGPGDMATCRVAQKPSTNDFTPMREGKQALPSAGKNILWLKA